MKQTSQVNIANIAIDAKKHIVGVSLLTGKRDSMQITLILLWRYPHLQQPRSPLQAGLKSRCRVIKKTDTTGPPSPREEMSTDSGTSMH